LIKRYIIANLACLADNDTSAMVNEYAAANYGAGMDINACSAATAFRYETCKECMTTEIKPMCPPVSTKRFQPGITQQDLQTAARCRIAGENCGNVLTKNGCHQAPPNQ
jgi:hypothetical protein